MTQAKFFDIGLNLVCGKCGHRMAAERVTFPYAQDLIVSCLNTSCEKSGVRYTCPIPVVYLKEVE